MCQSASTSGKGTDALEHAQGCIHGSPNLVSAVRAIRRIRTTSLGVYPVPPKGPWDVSKQREEEVKESQGGCLTSCTTRGFHGERRTEDRQHAQVRNSKGELCNGVGRTRFPLWIRYAPRRGHLIQIFAQPICLPVRLPVRKALFDIVPL